MFNEEDFTEGPIDLKYIQKLADKMPIFFFLFLQLVIGFTSKVRGIRMSPLYLSISCKQPQRYRSEKEVKT